MSKIAVIGRRGSDYRKKVDTWLGNVPVDQAHAVFNYGLQGEKLEAFMARRENARLNALPIINHVQYGNKMECVLAARKAGLSAPMAWKYRQREDIDANNLIIKPYYSLGGKGVRRIKSLDEITEEERRTHYIQEEIKNRRYEMRVIGSVWNDPREWRFMKRVHDDGENVLAWNAHNGGRFVTVNNPIGGVFDRLRDDVSAMFSLFHYGFGAVDFIVQNNPGGNLKHYFIEWNLAPGWSMARTEEYMKSIFLELPRFNLEALETFAEGLTLDEIRDGGRDRGFADHGGGMRRHVNIPMPNPDALQQWLDNNEPHLDYPEPPEIEYPNAERNAEMQAGPVLFRTAGTDRILKDWHMRESYIDIICHGCGITLFILRTKMRFCCPNCGIDHYIDL